MVVEGEGGGRTGGEGGGGVPLAEFGLGGTEALPEARQRSLERRSHAYASTAASAADLAFVAARLELRDSRRAKAKAAEAVELSRGEVAAKEESASQLSIEAEAAAAAAVEASHQAEAVRLFFWKNRALKGEARALEGGDTPPAARSSAIVADSASKAVESQSLGSQPVDQQTTALDAEGVAAAGSKQASLQHSLQTQTQN